MKIKNFMKYFKEGVLKYFKISLKFLDFKVKYFIVHSYHRVMTCLNSEFWMW